MVITERFLIARGEGEYSSRKRCSQLTPFAEPTSHPSFCFLMIELHSSSIRERETEICRSGRIHRRLLAHNRLFSSIFFKSLTKFSIFYASSLYISTPAAKGEAQLLRHEGRSNLGTQWGGQGGGRMKGGREQFRPPPLLLFPHTRYRIIPHISRSGEGEEERALKGRRVIKKLDFK